MTKEVHSRKTEKTIFALKLPFLFLSMIMTNRRRMNSPIAVMIAIKSNFTAMQISESIPVREETFIPSWNRILYAEDEWA